MEQNNEVKNKLYTITTNDFILKGIEEKIFLMSEIEKLNIDYKNMPFFTYVNTLIESHFLQINDVNKIISEMVSLRLPMLKQIDGKTYIVYKGKKEEINIGKNIPEIIKPLYKESVNLFDFNSKINNIVLYDIDHIKNEIITLIAGPTKETYDAILKFKKESKELRIVKKFFYKDKNGNDLFKESDLAHYNFTVIVVPLNLIQLLHSHNIDLGKGLEKSVETMQKRLNKIGINQTTTNNIVKIDKTLNETEGTITNILIQILMQQVELDASDIHIEPLLDSLNPELTNAGFVRYRVDGDLTPRERDANGEYIPTLKNKFDQLIYELKDKCGMKTQIKDIPQDGKLQIEIYNELLEYRVSVMPEGEVSKGREKAVLRKLSRDTSYLDLVKLNMDPDKKQMLDEFIGNPKEPNGKMGKYNNGIIIMTGPTGSGKSTTLFAILNQINIEELNIQTLEDPIEYVLPGLNQSQISDSSTNDTGSNSYTYAKGIKACLRQDPDVILIGEIRDEITMESAKDAAATGHLVFSSLHTNDTWQTLDRLEGIGFDLHLVGNIVRLIMAQRLGQLICPNCIKEYNDPVFSSGDRQKQQKREEEYLKLKMEIVRKLIDSKYITDLPDDISDIKLYEGEGNNCSICRGKKNKGRAGIYEFLPITLGVESFILKYGSKVSNEEVKKLFIREEITTLYQNALWKTFHPIQTENGPRFMHYNSAISAAGADMFDWGVEYADASYNELNLLLKKKKTERKIKLIDNEIRLLETKIANDEKMINNFNREEKMKKITKYKEELDIIKNKKREYLDYIKGLGL